MSKLAWYLLRLRVMPAPEFLYRARQQVTLAGLLFQYLLGTGIARPAGASEKHEFCTSKLRLLPALEFDQAELQKVSADLIKGRLPLAATEWRWETGNGVWHRAPDSGRRWPSRFFGTISYRDGNLTGDVRQLWETSRLQHLVDLAATVSIMPDPQRSQAAHMVTAQLESWVHENPPLAGPHYLSAMECSLRLIAVCHTLDMLRDELREKAPWNALVRIVASHAPLIARRLSLHSSSGNHTIAEAAGLVYGGLLFPEMRGARQWLDTGLTLLADAALSQVLPDGGGAEQSTGYHLFNLELFTLVTLLLEHHGREPPPEICAAIERGTGFLRAVTLPDGRLPPIGDSDGGRALSRHLRLPWGEAAPLPRTRVFASSGYTVAAISDRPETKVVFDHGPLGLRPCYGHGHADALSVLLAVGDRDVLIDPGTYTYTGDQRWRSYFRGTVAHNTVTVDNRDQARQVASFLWTRPYAAHLIASDFADDRSGRALAKHDGYRAFGVWHLRGIAWATNRWLLVWDGLYGEGLHELHLHWHFGTHLEACGDGEYRLSGPDEPLAFQCRGGTASLHRAERDPIIGWRSKAYGSIEPVTSLKLHYHGPLPHNFVTAISLPGGRIAGAEIEDALTWIRTKADQVQRGRKS